LLASELGYLACAHATHGSTSPLGTTGRFGLRRDVTTGATSRAYGGRTRAPRQAVSVTATRTDGAAPPLAYDMHSTGCMLPSLPFLSDCEQVPLAAAALHRSHRCALPPRTCYHRRYHLRFTFKHLRDANAAELTHYTTLIYNRTALPFSPLCSFAIAHCCAHRAHHSDVVCDVKGRVVDERGLLRRACVNCGRLPLLYSHFIVTPCALHRLSRRAGAATVWRTGITRDAHVLHSRHYAPPPTTVPHAAHGVRLRTRIATRAYGRALLFVPSYSARAFAWPTVAYRL